VRSKLPSKFELAGGARVFVGPRHFGYATEDGNIKQK